MKMDATNFIDWNRAFRLLGDFEILIETVSRLYIWDPFGKALHALRR